MECTTIQKCNGESELSRLSYIVRICRGFSNEREFELPTADEARSFDEALAYTVGLFPSKRDTGLEAGRSRVNLKDRLKDILNKLQWMERKRLYDPPSDHEIGSYLLLKKYVRAIFTFFSLRTDLDELFPDYYDNYDCGSYFCTLHQAEELIELNRYFAEFSAFVSEMNIEDGSMIKPLMGIRDNYEVPPLIHGSKERSNRFYHHKFNIARLDIRTLETIVFPPAAGEKRSYLQVLDHISSHPSALTKGEMSVYSEELYRQFLEKVEREELDMVRHCTSVGNSLLDKMSMPSWECLGEMYNQDPNKESVELSTKLTQKCGVPNEKLKNYTTCVERCRDIAQIMCLIVNERLLSPGCDQLASPTNNDPEIMRDYGWEALHVLTLLKHGSFSSGNVFREYTILRNSNSENAKMKLECREAKMWLKHCVDGSVKENENAKMKLERKEVKMGLKRCADGSVKENENVKMKLECKEAKMGVKRCADGSVKDNENVKMKLECKEAKMGLKRCAQGNGNENERVLRGIVEDLKCIGDSDILPDKEEYLFMYKIWYSVQSSVHFFFSAMAYEQRRYVTQRGGLLDVRKIRLRKNKRTKKSCTDVIELRNLAWQVTNHLSNFSYKMEQLTGILHAYSRGLRDKLESQTQQ